MLWEKQTSQGWTVMAFSASQLFLYLVLMVVVGMSMYSNGLVVLRTLRYVCNALGIIHHFAYIGMYSWTVVLTFDVWDKLSSMTQASKISTGKKRFFFYGCFGIGVPTLMVTVASIMEWGFREFPEDLVVMPGYSDNCVVTGRMAFVFYQGLPSAVLFAGNVALLVLTLRSLWKADKNSQILKEKGIVKSKNSPMNNKVVLIVKLMVLMGAFLVVDFIVNFFGLIGRNAWFTFLQAYRIFHAMGLFYLFVCSSKTKQQLLDKYPSLFTAPTPTALGQVGRKLLGTESSVVSYSTMTGGR